MNRNLQGNRILLENIAFIQPMICQESDIEAQVTLTPNQDGSIAFEITSGQPGSDTRVIHSQGNARLVAALATQQVAIPQLDTDNTSENTSEFQHTSGDDCYRSFVQSQVNYGPAHQGLTHLYASDEVVYAEVVLPDSVAATAQQFVLHPSLLDSALQATVGFNDKVLDGDNQALWHPHCLLPLIASTLCSHWKIP